MKVKLDRTTEAYMRMTAAGFTLGNPYVVEEAQYSSAVGFLDHAPVGLRVDFKCVCGGNETLNVMMNKGALRAMIQGPWQNGWDGALDIEQAGSVSVEHLTADGFSPEAIKRIRYVYDLHDEVKELRKLKQMYNASIGIYT